jgi:predicted dehydrogenase
MSKWAEVSTNRCIQTFHPPTYIAFYDALSGALTGHGRVPVTARDARNVIRIIELAMESSETGRSISLNKELLE